jgi:hypothetical protein
VFWSDGTDDAHGLLIRWLRAYVVKLSDSFVVMVACRLRKHSRSGSAGATSASLRHTTLVFTYNGAIDSDHRPDGAGRYTSRSYWKVNKRGVSPVRN